MTAGRALRLREHGTTRGVRLSENELADLDGCGAGVTIRPCGAGLYDVTANSRVGMVVAGSLSVHIEPKIPVRRLLRLLTLYTLPIDFGRQIRADDDDDLLTIMQEVFGQALERALRQGLPRGYTMESDRLHVARGRIDWMAMVTKRFGVFPPMECEYPSYTVDLEPNRRMLAAALLLARHTRGSSWAGKLRRLAGRMEGVAQVAYAPSNVAPLHLDRRFDHIAVALPLAELVLKHATIELREGVVHSLGMLVDMNRLFEDVVVEGLRASLRGRGRWVRQPTGLHLDEAMSVALRPDAVWFDDTGHARLIIDAKYKVTDMAKSQDLYQLTAYSQAMGVKRAALVYADAPRRAVVVKRDGPVIHTHRLDLNSDDLRSELDELAKELLAAADQATIAANSSTAR